MSIRLALFGTPTPTIDNRTNTIGFLNPRTETDLSIIRNQLVFACFQLVLLVIQIPFLPPGRLIITNEQLLVPGSTPYPCLSIENSSLCPSNDCVYYESIDWPSQCSLNGFNLYICLFYAHLYMISLILAFIHNW